MALLEIHNLSVDYLSPRGRARALDGVSMKVEEGGHLGLIGESGCGKTTLARALVRVLPRNGRIRSGAIFFKGRNLLDLSAREMRALRWTEIATVPQASMDALDPVQRVGRQLETILTVRGGLDRGAARRRAADLFDLVRLDRDGLMRYPHEFSGGMKQRAVIAMALALHPSLLIADEPVTALDVIVQYQVLDLLRQLQQELKLTVLLITHDISVVAQVCDTVAVMYAGRLVEEAPAASFFGAAAHPYSLGLQHAFPNLADPEATLISIEGYPPDLVAPPEGCRFAVRCPFAQPACKETDPPMEPVGPKHRAACLRVREMDVLRPQAADLERWMQAEALRSFDAEAGPSAVRESDWGDGAPAPDHAVLLDVQGVFKRFHMGSGLAGLIRRQGLQTVHAVNDVSFTLKRGESLGLAGESGCGKTTTGKLLINLLVPSEGSIRFDGKDLSSLSATERKAFRRRAQLMFQNPFEALNPRFTLYRTLAEPLIIHGWRQEDERRARVLETLERVNLQPQPFFLDKYPHQLSGGQLQRVVLARALVLRPDFLIADEPVSMLDVSVRAGILNTMRSLAEETHLTTLYISHDLSLLHYVCDRIAVMYLGRIVEMGPAHQVIEQPHHPYSRALVSAVPVPDPARPKTTLRIREGVPRATQTFQGCPFRERCPEAMDRCGTVPPPWVEVAPGQHARCHLYGEN